MRQARRGLGHVYQRGKVWWVQYWYRGQRTRESSGSDNRASAVKLLRKRLGEIGQGRLVGPEPEKVALSDLKVMLLDDYALKGNASTIRAAQCFRHVLGHFGVAARALDVTTDRLVAYAKERQESGGAPATVKNELAILRRAFNLAVRAGRLPHRPAFPVIEARNARTGFFEEGEFRAVLAHMPPAVQAVAEFLYLTGWRAGEVLGLEWRAVDLSAGVLRIETSKNKEARTLPFRALPALDTLLRRQRRHVENIQSARGKVITRVFVWDDGRPIRDFRGSWDAAFEDAGLPRRIPHDCRRTAARNLSRAGVPERVIMSLCGWKTRAVFDRYRIVNEADLAEGLAKLAKAGESEERAAPKVVQMRTATVQPQ